jgi:pimeloyl-ACP methyl ester carboxylesterase
MQWIWLVTACGAVLAGMGAVAERWIERRDRKSSPPPGRIVPLGDGRSLHLLCEGNGPAVVVEQGAGEPSILWRPLQRRAADFCTFCLYDRAGYGWSPQARIPQPLEARASDLRLALSAAGVAPPYILVAHSYGGLVALAFARLYPDGTAGLLMVDAIDEGLAAHPDYRAFVAKGRWFVRLLRGAAALGMLRLVARLFSNAEEPPEERMAGAEMVRPGFFAAIGGDLRTILALEPGTRPPPLGDLPLTVITHGKPFPGPFAALERLWRPEQDRIARLSTRGRLVVATESNHMIASDEPDLVLAELERLVEQGGFRPPA